VKSNACIPQSRALAEIASPSGTPRPSFARNTGNSGLVTDEHIAEIRSALQSADRIDRDFAVEIKDESGELVAEVQKTIQVRKKSSK
jgi:hypothetical protein